MVICGITNHFSKAKLISVMTKSSHAFIYWYVQMSVAKGMYTLIFQLDYKEKYLFYFDNS